MLRTLIVRSLVALAASLSAHQALAQSSTYVEQIGDSHRVSVTQSGSNNGRGALGGEVLQSGEGHSATVLQDGDDNDFRVQQADAGAHEAIIGQQGAGNLASINQRGDAKNVAAIVQTGDTNRAYVTQNAILSGNSVSLLQTGDNNLADLDQTGGGNKIDLAQNGSNNSLFAVQTGDNNNIAFRQNGDALPTVMISQTGGANIEFTQTQFAPFPATP